MTPAMPECLKPYAHRMVGAVFLDVATADDACGALVDHLIGASHYSLSEYEAASALVKGEKRKVHEFWGNAIDPCS